jgi:PAS domain S-box-containing protein
MQPLDLVPFACCTLDDEGLIANANRAARTLLDVSSEGLLGAPFARFVHDDDQAAFATLKAALRNSGEMSGSDLRMRARHGTSRWVRIEGLRSDHESGAPAFGLALLDIHDRRESDEARLRAILRMQAQQEALTGASLSGAFLAGDVETLAREITELSARTANVSRASVWIFNEAETELRCIDLYDSNAARHSANAVLLESQYRTEFEALKGSRFVDASEPASDPRTRGYLETYLKPLRVTALLDALVAVSGRRLGLLRLEQVDTAHRWEKDEIAFACQLAEKLALSLINRARRDAQATLRSSEIRYRRLFESANDGILILDAETGVVVDANPFLVDLVGIPREALLGTKVWEIGLLKPVLSSEAGFHDLVRLEHMRHDDVALEISGGRLLDAEVDTAVYLVNQVRVVQCHVRDMTARKRTEDSLRQDLIARKAAEQALENSLAEKEALLKEVHHRVKNNLQVISSLLRLESARSDEPGARRVLKEMQGRILSMALLHEALYRSGDFRRVDLGAYLKQLAEQFFRSQNLAPSLVRLETAVASCYVSIDQAIPCGLIVNELMTNCLKHGFPEGKGGEVRVLVRSGSEGRIAVEVSDSGIGLPDDFDARRSASLGVQLVTDLTRQIGGSLQIGEGPGSQFIVTFGPALSVSTGPTARPSLDTGAPPQA